MAIVPERRCRESRASRHVRIMHDQLVAAPQHVLGHGPAHIADPDESDTHMALPVRRREVDATC